MFTSINDVFSFTFEVKFVKILCEDQTPDTLKRAQIPQTALPDIRL